MSIFLFCRYVKFIRFFVLIFILQGCAFHYYDPVTQAEHLFGIGHMVMKVHDVGINKIATVRGYSSFGLSTGIDESGGHFAAGWSSHRSIRLLQSDASIELIWPSNDFLNVRIGEPFAGQAKFSPKANSLREP